MKKEITYWLICIIAAILLTDILVYIGHYEALPLTIGIFALCAKTNQLGTKLPNYSSYLCGCIVVYSFFTLMFALPILGHLEGQIAKDLLNIVGSTSSIIILLFTLLGLHFEETSPNHKAHTKYSIENSI